MQDDVITSAKPYKDTCIRLHCLQSKHGCPRGLISWLLMLDRVPIIGRYLAACASATEGLQRLAGVWMLAASLQWPGVRRAFHNQQSSWHTHKRSRYQRIRAGGLEEPNATIGSRASRPTQESLSSQRQSCSTCCCQIALRSLLF